MLTLCYSMEHIGIYFDQRERSNFGPKGFLHISHLLVLLIYCKKIILNFTLQLKLSKTDKFRSPYFHVIAEEVCFLGHFSWEHRYVFTKDVRISFPGGRGKATGSINTVHSRPNLGLKMLVPNIFMCVRETKPVV